MKRLIACMTAVLMALTSGGAVLATAAETTVAAPAQETRTAQERALREMGLITGETQYSWKLAYESYYSGAPGLNKTGVKDERKNTTVRSELIYPVIRGYEELLCAMGEYGWGKALREHVYDFEVFLQARGRNYNVEPGENVPTQENGYYGIGTIYSYRMTPDSDWEFSNSIWLHDSPDDYQNPRINRLIITPQVEQLLLERGFDPSLTRAWYLKIDTLNGNLLYDGVHWLMLGINNNQEIVWDWSDFSVWREQMLAKMEKKKAEADLPPPGDDPTPEANPGTGKPVIYLYPQQPTDVSVKLDYRGPFSYTYPAYENGWSVTAYPDGRLVDKGGNEYYYLFWEGNEKVDWDFSKGFLVDGTDTVVFLQEKLKYLGLNAREINDFITYWAPEMARNDRNIITFSYEQYEALAPLTVSPKPDTVLRVHMVYKRYDGGPVPAPQELKPTARNGFTVVEWGGTRA